MTTAEDSGGKLPFMSLNHELAALFKSFAQIMEIRGENTFKVIAFTKVSRILNDMTFDLRKCFEEGKLCDLEGIGASSQKIIEEYIKIGRSVDYEEVAASVPAGLIPLLEIPGLGPKTINQVWKQRGITNLEGLVKALDDGSLLSLKGLGQKKIDGIKQGIELRSQAAGRMGIVDALPIAQSLVQRLRELPGVKQAQIAGSLRRCRETIGDVDLLCSLSEKGSGAAIAAAFVKFPEVQRVLVQGPSKSSVLTAGGLQVDLRIVPAENFGAASLYFTGSKEHNVKLRGRALDQELTLNEWGLYKLSEYDKAAKKTAEAPPIKPAASRTEHDVYEKLGLSYIEPELREDRGEIEAAEQKLLPELVKLQDIKGDLHTHTTASDGIASIEQMAEAAAELGYEYLAITDHSKSQVIANGLTADRLLAHIKQIHKVRDRLKGIHLLAGCEVDILIDGRLDFEDAILAELDFVVASPHISLKQDERKATDRILRAVENPYVNVIGHPTGRLIDRRPGLPLSFEPIFRAAAAAQTVMEINAGYPRLDLNELNARAAINAGVVLCINTDAHSTEELSTVNFGVNVARRAWASKANVLNCLSWTQLRDLLQRKRKLV